MEDKAVLASGTGSMQWAVRHTGQPGSKWTQEIAMETWLKERERKKAFSSNWRSRRYIV